MSLKHLPIISALAFRATRLCLIVLVGLAAGQAMASEPVVPPSEDQAWTKSYDPTKKRRFIPVELWTGAAWSGKNEIIMGKANLDFGSYKTKQIRGPKQWRHNVTKKHFKVYDRRAMILGTKKIQYFTVRNDDKAIGRVYDSRKSYAYLSPGAKFPLGYWTQGETRTFKATLLDKAYKSTGGLPLIDLGFIDQTRTRTRVMEMTIKDLHYTFAGMKHCLRFHWRIVSERRAFSTFQYIYCPRRGLVDVTRFWPK